MFLWSYCSTCDFCFFFKRVVPKFFVLVSLSNFSWLYYKWIKLIKPVIHGLLYQISGWTCIESRPLCETSYALFWVFTCLHGITCLNFDVTIACKIFSSEYCIKNLSLGRKILQKSRALIHEHTENHRSTNALMSRQNRWNPI